VPSAPAGADVAVLRAHVEAHLPASMVPSVIRVVDALPLTANGKIDRRVLALEPARDPVPSEAPGVLCDRIAALVAGILSREGLGPTQSFLDLGAHSVDMIRIANRIESEFGFRPRLDALYREPTVAALARACAASTLDPVADAPERRAPGPAAAKVIRDPDERAAFKERRPGLRTDLAGAVPALALPIAVLQEKRLASRRTERRFAPGPVPLKRIGALLGCLRQTGGTGLVRCAYPSAGGLYPVQTYVHLKSGRVRGAAPGLYYHDPIDHRLVPLAPGLLIDREIHEPLVNTPVFDACAFSIFLVGRLAAIEPLYGALGRDFCLLEAGAMLQLLMLEAPRIRLGLCPVGRLDFDRIRPAFRLDAGDCLIHSLLGGGAAPRSSRPREEAVL
jgi:SagB-type dehydrogenase family enzyme